MYKKALIIIGSIVLVLTVVMTCVLIFVLSENKPEGDTIENYFNIVDMFDETEKNSDERKYSKDVQALDAVSTAVMLMVVNPDTDWSLANNKVTTLKSLMDVGEKNDILMKTLQEIFDENGEFRNSSSAFENVTTEDIYIRVVNGAVSVNVKSRDKDFDDFQDPKGVDLFD